VSLCTAGTAEYKVCAVLTVLWPSCDLPWIGGAHMWTHHGLFNETESFMCVDLLHTCNTVADPKQQYLEGPLSVRRQQLVL
jgi:hypothetical protein